MLSSNCTLIYICAEFDNAFASVFPVSVTEFLLCCFSENVQALDTFNTVVVSPIYYVMFTSCTILASVIMFKVLNVAAVC